ncbi:MAG: hypothetical protein Q8R69_18740 [Telluria sp.]|nr:hypothetical protein [Telluria sp.]
MARKPTFTFEIHCGSGILCRGASEDFLLVVYRAKFAKIHAASQLPNSTLRAQILAPNGARVSSADIKSSLTALEDSFVLSLLRKRNPASFPQFLAGRGAVAFSQAGVVAPPDSPDLGNLPDSNTAFSKG